MTPQQINERIAKLCGWFPTEDTESGLWHLSNMNGRRIGYRSALSEDHAWKVLCPDYYHSLDECAAFEKLIQGDGSDPEVYEDTLASIVGVYDDWYEGISFREAAKLVYATPAQRCEAFLRMKGQWE